jgi:hypothetical protein
MGDESKAPPKEVTISSVCPRGTQARAEGHEDHRVTLRRRSKRS